MVGRIMVYFRFRTFLSVVIPGTTELHFYSYLNPVLSITFVDLFSFTNTDCLYRISLTPDVCFLVSLGTRLCLTWQTTYRPP